MSAVPSAPSPSPGLGAPIALDMTTYPRGGILPHHSHRIYHTPSPGSSSGTSISSEASDGVAAVVGRDHSPWPHAVPRLSPRLAVDTADVDMETGVRIESAGHVDEGVDVGFGIDIAHPRPRSLPRAGHGHTRPRHPFTASLPRPFPSPSPPCARRALRTHASRPATPCLLPPSDGTSPISLLPDEVLLHILSFLPQPDILSSRRLCKRIAHLALAPALHRSLTLFALPSLPLNPTGVLAQHILPSLHHLHLHLFPYPPTTTREPHPTTVLLALLDRIPADQLRSLVIPFSAPYLPAHELGTVLQRLGGRLEKLDLRGSGIVGARYLEWMGGVGVKGRGLRELDLGFTSISALPLAAAQSDLQGAASAGAPVLTPPVAVPHTWDLLRHLSLGSCSSLSSDVLAAFLAKLPPKLETLDLSRLEQVSFPALRSMRVVVDIDSSVDPIPNALREIKLVGIDHLTRSNIRTLKRHWETQREPAYPTLFAPRPVEQRVWGEPRAQQRVSNTPHTPPRSYATGDADEYGPTPSTPALSSRCSSAASSASVLSDVDIARASTLPNASVLAAHSALWDSLAGDRSDGIFATSDVYASKLPSHAYLPSRSALRADEAPETVRQHAIAAFPTLHPPSPGTGLGRGAELAPRMSRRDVRINIVHSAILESEDEEGYRLFIGQVAGGVQPPPAVEVQAPGLGLGVGMGQDAQLMGLGLGFGVSVGATAAALANSGGTWTWGGVGGGGGGGGAGLGLGMGMQSAGAADGLDLGGVNWGMGDEDTSVAGLGFAV